MNDGPGRSGRFIDEQFQAFLDAMPDATLVVSQDGLIRAVNPNAARLFGYGPGELVGRSLEALIPNRLHERHGRHQRDYFTAPRTRPMGAELDICGLTRDGRELPLEISLSPVPMADGAICTVAAVRDTTQRKDWERTLERAKYLAENIVETVRQPLVVLTPDLKVRAANEAFFETFQVGRERVEGRFLYDIGNRDWDNPQVRGLLAQILSRDHEIVDFEFQHDFERLGRRIMCLNARRIDSLQLILLAIEDITERTRRQRALQESEERLHLALEAGKLGTWDTDLVRGTTYWDPICRAIFGVAEDEPAGLDRGMDIIHPEDRAAALEAFEQATAPGSAGIYEMEKRILRPDGEVRWVATHGRVLFAGDGADRRPVRIIGVVMETTERRRAEATLQAAKQEAERADALKSRFLAATSHDLRQPLQTLRLLQGVLARTVSEAGSRKIVDDLGQTITSMAEIVDTLLDINRLESGAIEPELIDFPVNSALERVQSEFRLLAENRGVLLRVVPSSAIVRTDPRLLDRLIENLVSNAIKYTETGKILLGCRRRSADLSIQVWDTGIGIPGDKLASIFDEYYQIDNPAMERGRGLGLGLALVQRIAHLLGHPIEVRSTHGKGSVFAITVPLRVAAGSARPRAPLVQFAPAASSPAVAVLLVEDDLPVRASLQIFLQLEGYAVSTAGTAGEALALVAGGAIRPAIVIADRNLPGGMSGPALCQELGKALPEAVPAIVLTGDSSPETAQEIAESGAEHVLKPVAPEKLAALVQHLLRRQPPVAPGPLRTPIGPAVEAQPAGSRATVHVVDDDPAVRRAMHALLERLGYAVETFATAEAFLAAYRPRDLECLLVDVSMPGMNGLQLQEALHDRRIAVPVIVVTGRQEVPVAVQAMRAGAVDFLEKPVSGERLLEALERALESGLRTAEAASARAEVEGRRARLTPREREVLDLIVEGLSTKEIAARLGISPRTAENHRARVMEKMGAGSLAELVRMALAAPLAPDEREADRIRAG